MDARQVVATAPPMKSQRQAVTTGGERFWRGAELQHFGLVPIEALLAEAVVVDVERETPRRVRAPAQLDEDVARLTVEPEVVDQFAGAHRTHPDRGDLHRCNIVERPHDEPAMRVRPVGRNVDGQAAMPNVAQRGILQ